VLGMTAAWLPQQLAVLCTRMGMSREEAQNLLLQEPCLLLRSPGALSGCLEALVSSFHLDAATLLQVGSLISLYSLGFKLLAREGQPGGGLKMLTTAASGITRWLQPHCCGRRGACRAPGPTRAPPPPGPRVQVVEFDPSVLLESPGELAQRCSQFSRLACSNRAWRQQYT
jgi:hypothetical protein